MRLFFTFDSAQRHYHVVPALGVFLTSSFPSIPKSDRNFSRINAIHQ